jgi:O2-independent ubiquinone biosynthesis accessory factor UbiT
VKPPAGFADEPPSMPGRSEVVPADAALRLPAFVRHLLPGVAAFPLGPALTLSLRALARRRPRLFERLGAHARDRFFIDPIDLAFAFDVVPDGARSIVRAVRKSDTAMASVMIRGPLLALLGLLDGTLDGDALFFNRIISISGRTEAVLALRNAIEDGELSPADLLGLTGPLARLANEGVMGGLSLARRLAASAQDVPARQP